MPALALSSVPLTSGNWSNRAFLPRFMVKVPSLKRPVPPRFRIIDSDGPLAEWDDEINGNCDGIGCFTPQCHYNLYGIASSALWSMVALEAH